jgi:hypothetical protein
VCQLYELVGWQGGESYRVIRTDGVLDADVNANAEAIGVDVDANTIVVRFSSKPHVEQDKYLQ